MNIVKKISIAAFIAVLGTTAQAADAAGPWQGGYAGILAGARWATADYSEPAYPEFARSARMDGFSAGLYAGYNWQRGDLVYGVDADLAWSNRSAAADENSLYNDYSAFKAGNSGRVRARVGYASHASLFYVAGGLAMSRFTVDDTDSGWGQSTATQTGWSLGAGVEQQLGKQLSLRTEFLYDDYGSKSYSIAGDKPYSASVKLKDHIVRIGVGYRF